jgi:hypothetical protein
MAPRSPLFGRGLTQSKVAPAPGEERETLDLTADGGLDRLQTLLTKTGWTYDEGPAKGAFEDVKTVTVVSVNGTPVRFVLEDGREIASGEDLETISETVGGKRRSRLNVKRRRTQRNGRGRKHRKLRKLTTRRR